MPDFVTKPAAPQRRRREGIHVPGIFEWWHRAHCASIAKYAMVDRDHDPRFADPDAPFDDAAREAKLVQARKVAEDTALQVISRGKPITAKLLRPRHRLGVWWQRGSGVRVPDTFEGDVLYDIHADDVVTVNVIATQRYRERAAAEEARRKTVAAQQESGVPSSEPSGEFAVGSETPGVEHNGHDIAVVL
jgi:hypothetical protein